MGKEEIIEKMNLKYTSYVWFWYAEILLIDITTSMIVLYCRMSVYSSHSTIYYVIYYAEIVIVELSFLVRFNVFIYLHPECHEN